MKVFFDLACMSTCCWGLPKPKYQSFITHNRGTWGDLEYCLGQRWILESKMLKITNLQWFSVFFPQFHYFQPHPPPPQLHYQHNILNDRNLVNINVNMNFRMSVCILSSFALMTAILVLHDLHKFVWHLTWWSYSPAWFEDDPKRILCFSGSKIIWWSTQKWFTWLILIINAWLMHD